MPELSALIPQRRARCADCGRPKTHCLCGLLPDLIAHTQLLVIQHPDEQHHALNTARLLVAGLRNAQLLVTEQLSAQWCESLADPALHTELLFPGVGVPEVAAMDTNQRPRRLVLLDGTWRKARKLLYLNPVLQRLPQVALPAGLTSRYRLRKAPGPGALSTIEAGMHALQLIEPGVDFSSLLRPFDALIEGQIRAMGQVVYQKNHLRPRHD